MRVLVNNSGINWGALRRVPGERLDARADAEPAPRLHHDAAADAAARGGLRVGRQRRESWREPAAREPHWLRGQDTGAGARDVCVREFEGGFAPAEPRAGESSWSAGHHVRFSLPPFLSREATGGRKVNQAGRGSIGYPSAGPSSPKMMAATLRQFRDSIKTGILLGRISAPEGLMYRICK
jgi:hypothetical protein